MIQLLALLFIIVNEAASSRTSGQTAVESQPKGPRRTAVSRFVSRHRAVAGLLKELGPTIPATLGNASLTLAAGPLLAGLAEAYAQPSEYDRSASRPTGSFPDRSTAASEAKASRAAYQRARAEIDAWMTTPALATPQGSTARFVRPLYKPSKFASKG